MVLACLFNIQHYRWFFNPIPNVAKSGKEQQKYLRPKYHRPGGLNNNQLFFTVLEVGSLKLGCQHGQVLDKCPFPGLQRAVFLLCPHMAERAES